MLEQMVEEKLEVCSTVSKLVRIKIFRKRVDGDTLQEGEIIGFECGSSSSNCETRCSYKLLMNDF